MSMIHLWSNAFSLWHIYDSRMDLLWQTAVKGYRPQGSFSIGHHHDKVATEGGTYRQLDNRIMLLMGERLAMIAMIE